MTGSRRVTCVADAVRESAAPAMAALAATTAVAQLQGLTMWSHWPEASSKRGSVEERVKAFEAANPQCRVNLQFIRKADIDAEVKEKVRTGQASDSFRLGPDRIKMAMAGHLEPLDAHLELENLEDWARKDRTHAGQVCGQPLEACSVELMHNRILLEKVGVNLPASGQLNQAQFADLVRKSVAAGITPLAQGVGDRPFPGTSSLQEPLLRKPGRDDCRPLLTGELPLEDPRVVEVMNFAKTLVDAPACPKNFATLMPGESQARFHASPGAETFSRVPNKEFSGGQFGVNEAVGQLDAACSG